MSWNALEGVCTLPQQLPQRPHDLTEDREGPIWSEPARCPSGTAKRRFSFSGSSRRPGRPAGWGHSKTPWRHGRGPTPPRGRTWAPVVAPRRRSSVAVPRPLLPSRGPGWVGGCRGFPRRPWLPPASLPPPVPVPCPRSLSRFCPVLPLSPHSPVRIEGLEHRTAWSFCRNRRTNESRGRAGRHALLDEVTAAWLDNNLRNEAMSPLILQAFPTSYQHDVIKYPARDRRAHGIHTTHRDGLWRHGAVLALVGLPDSSDLLEAPSALREAVRRMCDT